LIDLLAGDVDLNGWYGKPAHGRQGLDRVKESTVGSIHPSLGALGLSERHPFPRYLARVLRLMKAVGEPTSRGGVGEHPFKRARRRASKLVGDVAYVFT
jgi:hypothetical protein